MTSLLTSRLGPGLIVALGLLLAPMAQAESLGDAFATLPKETRVAVQQELARADLYLANTDGTWNASTERALLRSVETIALRSNDMLHPTLRSPHERKSYLESLGGGAYSRLLYGGNLIQRIFLPRTDPGKGLDG